MKKPSYCHERISWNGRDANIRFFCSLISKIHENVIRIAFFTFLMIVFGSPSLASNIPTSKKLIQLSFAPLVKQTGPAVVNIFAKTETKNQNISPLFVDPFFRQFFGDIFSDIFGGSSRGRSRSGGGDLAYNISISLEEAVRGTEVNLQIPSKERCKGKWSTCSYCSGTGVVRMQQGFFSMQQTCPQCRGEGEIHDPNCNICHGQGFIKKDKTLSVKIPAGIDSGDRIRLSGEGESGRGNNPNGDLFITVEIQEHKIFQRDGRHLYCEIPINYIDAVLGGDVEVPTLEGKVKLKIPSGTQSHKLMRLKGKGIRPINGASKLSLIHI